MYDGSRNPYYLIENKNCIIWLCVCNYLYVNDTTVNGLCQSTLKCWRLNAKDDKIRAVLVTLPLVIRSQLVQSDITCTDLESVRIGPVHFQAGRLIRQPNLALVFTTRSELCKVLFLALSVTFLCEISRGTAELICAKFKGKTCLVSRSDELEGQRSRSPATKKRHLAACVRFSL